jgi:hypothetical protein
MDNLKFLGICILLASVILSAAIVWHGKSGVGRYQFQASTPPGVIWKLDTATGEVTTQSG